MEAILLKQPTANPRCADEKGSHDHAHESAAPVAILKSISILHTADDAPA